MTIAKDSTLTGGLLRGVTGPLVKLPILGTLGYTTLLQGSATSSLNPGNATINPDGSTNVLQLSVPAGPPNSASIQGVCQGTAFGVRWRRDTAVAPFFDLIIDGVSYPVDDTNSRLDNVSAGAITDYEASYIVTGLPDRRHTWSVIVACDKVGGASRTVNVYGFIAERGRGYNEVAPVPRFGLVAAPAFVPAAAAVIYSPTNPDTPVTALTLRNTDTAAAHTVAIYGPDGSTVWRKVTLTAAGATATTSDAGADITINFPTPRTLQGWKWVTDTASKVAGYVEYA